MNIVLVPGVFGFGRLGLLQYFNGVAEHLEKTFQNVRVASASTYPLGTVAVRAAKLAEEIVGFFGPSQEVHLIAHSMGGLDARFLVSRDLEGLRARVKTIATVGTPHHGSPVATTLEAANPLDFPTGFPALEGDFVEELRGKLDALHDLTQQGAAALNVQCADVPGIRYLEIAGVGRDGLFHTSAFFVPTYLYVYAKAGPNDGIVPVTSAERQRPLFASWPGDHADLIGHDLNGPTPMSRPQLNHFLIYEDIIRRGILLYAA